jgi:hypothetical protein
MQYGDEGAAREARDEQEDQPDIGPPDDEAQPHALRVGEPEGHEDYRR